MHPKPDGNLQSKDKIWEETVNQLASSQDLRSTKYICYHSSVQPAAHLQSISYTEALRQVLALHGCEEEVSWVWWWWRPQYNEFYPNQILVSHSTSLKGHLRAQEFLWKKN